MIAPLISQLRTHQILYHPFLTCFPSFASQSPTGRGHTRLSHIRDSPLIMPLVAWWEKICAPSDWRTLIWCSALPFSPPLRLAQGASQQPSACIRTPAHGKCADKFPQNLFRAVKKNTILRCIMRKALCRPTEAYFGVCEVGIQRA